MGLEADEDSALPEGATPILTVIVNGSSPPGNKRVRLYNHVAIIDAIPSNDNGLQSEELFYLDDEHTPITSNGPGLARASPGASEVRFQEWMESRNNSVGQRTA